MFLISMSSFFYFIGRRYPIYAIDDGSLTKSDKGLLNKFFDIQVISTTDSTKNAKKQLSKKKYPHFYEYRFHQPNTFSKVKFDALLFCPFERVICIDSDVLFFRPPKRIIHWLEGEEKKALYNVHNWKNVDDAQLPDMEHAFRELLAKFIKKDFTFRSTFNAGLFMIPNKKMMDLRKLDRLFKLFNEISYSRYSIVDETALGCLLTNPKIGEALDPHEYIVAPFLIDYPQEKSRKIQAIHYAAESKGIYPLDAVELVLKTHFFASVA